MEDNNIGPGQAREFADEETPAEKARRRRRAKKHCWDTPEKLIEAREEELRAGDPDRKKMRREYTPADLPIKEDKDLDDCP